MPVYDFNCSDGHVFERVVPLAEFDLQQFCECGSEAFRMVSAPAVKSDYLTPTRGADGKIHDTKSGYYASLEPSGNPKGERYHILGAGERTKHVDVKFDRKERRDAIKQAMAEIKSGNVKTGD